MELLAGCGSSRVKKIFPTSRNEWSKLVTLDMNDAHKPDVVHDLTVLPYPFENDTFEEIHFYDVLEHLSQQGDYKTFFAQFSEFWRILKPGGFLCGSSPGPDSRWRWGDPGHTRIMGPECLVFLNQEEYRMQVGKSPMTDYRFCYQADFKVIYTQIQGPSRQHVYVVQAVKPSRIVLR